MAYEIRARSLGEILDGAFQLYRNHFSTFFAAAAGISLPSLAVVAVLNWTLTGTAFAAPDPTQILQFWWVMLLTAPITFLSNILQNAVLTTAIADAYLGRPVSVGAAFRRTVPLLGSLIGVTLITAVGISLGMLLLIIPGIILALNWFFTVQAIAIEGCGVSEALKRSKTLTKGRRGRLSVLLFLVTIIVMAINFGVATIIPDALSALPVVGPLLQQFPMILLAPIYPAVITLAYFDARVRNEAFDLEMLSRSIDSSAPASMFVATPT